MTTGNSAQQAADALRDKLQDEYESGLDRVPTAREESRLRDMGIEPDDGGEAAVRAAGYGAAGILGGDE
jgi:hypothetical protein